jgi:hypothetical protein
VRLLSVRGTKKVDVAVTLTALLCTTPSHPMHAQSRPFTPQVEEFVDIYLKHGGDKLTTWVQGQV